MADLKVKISEFPPATISKDSDDIAILQDGINKKIKSPILESKILDKVEERYVNKNKLGVNNGVATLDSDGLLSLNQRPPYNVQANFVPINLLSPPSELDGVFVPTESGTYENYGNIEIDLNEGTYIITKIGDQYEKSLLAIQSPKSVDTISELRLREGDFEGQIITLLGYYEAGDKELLNYKWSSEQGVDDGGSVINTESGSWIAISLNNSYFVEDFGVVRYVNNKQEENALAIKKMIESNFKVLFSEGYYYIGEILIDNNSVTEIFIKGQSYGDSINSDKNTLIYCANFLKLNKDSYTRLKLEGIHFVGQNRIGTCIGQEFPTSIKDLFIDSSYCNFYNFEKAIYTNGYMTSLNIHKNFFGGNEIGIYSVRESNFSKISNTDFISNEVACRISGFQTIIEQCQLSMFDANYIVDKTVGFWIEYGATTISNIYYEEYSYTPELMTPDKFSMFKLKTRNGEPNEYININDTTFVFDDYITHLEIEGNFDNAININGTKDYYLPKNVTYLNDNLGRGVIINGNNIYYNSSVTIMNKREFNIISNTGYSHNFGNNFKNFKITYDDIKGCYLIPNYNNTVSWNNILDPTHKSIVLQLFEPNSNATDFEIEFNFSMECANTTDVFSFQLLLPLDGGYKIIQSNKPLEVSTGVFRVFFSGKFKGDISMLHSGILHIGFKDNIPNEGTFEGIINIKNV